MQETEHFKNLCDILNCGHNCIFTLKLLLLTLQVKKIIGKTKKEKKYVVKFLGWDDGL